MIYVYALFEKCTGSIPPLAGIGGTPVRHELFGQIAVAISECAATRPEPVAENLWAHERVVEALMDQCTLLPVRFGTVYSSREELAVALDRHTLRLLSGFDRVRGCVELGLRVMSETLQLAPARIPEIAHGETHLSGRGYMHALASEHRERARFDDQIQELINAIQRPLASLAREHTRRGGAAAPLLFSGAYLVDRSKVAEFKNRVSDLANDHGEEQFLCTGPWPPYNFVPMLGAELGIAEVSHA